MAPDLDRLRIQRPGEGAPSAGRRWRLWLALAGLLFATLGGLYVWGPLQPAQEVAVAPVARVFPYQAYTVLNASGYVVAQRKAAVSSKSTGRLVYLGVEEGSRVKKGQVVASLENEDLQATKNQAAAQVKEAEAGILTAQAELTDARLQYERYQTLLKQDLVSRQDYDAAEARYRKALAGVNSARAHLKAARAALDNAAASLDYSYIRSPFDGVVTTKQADVGEVVAPFGAAANARAAVVTMADLGSLMVEADVAEANLDLIRQGQPCEISLDALPGKRFAGQVHMIVPTADRTKATVLTKVKFLDFDDRILPEMSAKVAFLSRTLDPGERQAVLAVSKKALVTKNGKTMAFRLDGAVVHLVAPTLGPDLGDFAEVKAGLKEGDKVVLSPPGSLKDGSRVKLKD